MSLINDALKKAQKQREGSATVPPMGTVPPAPPGPAAPLSPSTPAPGGKNQVALIVAGAAVIVSLSVAATVYLLRKDAGAPAPAPPAVASALPKPAPATTAPATPTSVAVTPAPTSAPPAVVAPAPSVGPAVSVAADPKGNAPATTPALLPASSTVATTGPQTNPPSVPADQTGAAAVSPPPPSATVASPPAAAPATTAAPVPAATPDLAGAKSTYRIQGLVDKFRISGIRLADTDSKVLLNDHLFRINDLVEPSLGLRLTAIEPHALTFTDASGNVYLKRF